MFNKIFAEMDEIEWLHPEELAEASDAERNDYERRIFQLMEESDDNYEKFDSMLDEDEEQTAFLADSIVDSDIEELQLPEYNPTETDSEEDFDECIEETNTFQAKDDTIWSSQPIPYRKMLSHNIRRSVFSGPTRKTEGLNIMQTFKQLISFEIIDIIIRETNRKARQIFEDAHKKNPAGKQREWKPVTTSEFDAFLGIIILAGVSRSNSVHATDL